MLAFERVAPREGFQRALDHVFYGRSPDIDYAPEGFSYSLEAPLAARLVVRTRSRIRAGGLPESRRTRTADRAEVRAAEGQISLGIPARPLSAQQDSISSAIHQTTERILQQNLPQAGVSSCSKVAHRTSLDHLVSALASMAGGRGGGEGGRHACDMLCVLAVHGLVDYSALR
jgi:hypothetical protein